MAIEGVGCHAGKGGAGADFFKKKERKERTSEVTVRPEIMCDIPRSKTDIYRFLGETCRLGFNNALHRTNFRGTIEPKKFAKSTSKEHTKLHFWKSYVPWSHGDFFLPCGYDGISWIFLYLHVKTFVFTKKNHGFRIYFLGGCIFCECEYFRFRAKNKGRYMNLQGLFVAQFLTTVP
jgi:hypothetical protein